MPKTWSRNGRGLRQRGWSPTERELGWLEPRTCRGRRKQSSLRRAREIPGPLVPNSLRLEAETSLGVYRARSRKSLVLWIGDGGDSGKTGGTGRLLGQCGLLRQLLS